MIYPIIKRQHNTWVWIWRTTFKPLQAVAVGRSHSFWFAFKVLMSKYWKVKNTYITFKTLYKSNWKVDREVEMLHKVMHEVGVTSIFIDLNMKR